MQLRLYTDRIENSASVVNTTLRGQTGEVGDLLTDKKWKSTSWSHSFSYFQILKHSKPVCDTQEVCPAAPHALGLWLQLQTLPWAPTMFSDRMERLINLFNTPIRVLKFPN